MSGLESNKERALAKEFILNTRRNVFLRGKAGTGLPCSFDNPQHDR